MKKEKYNHIRQNLEIVEKIVNIRCELYSEYRVIPIQFSNIDSN